MRPARPFFARTGDLEACLDLLGSRPLKLIADAVVPEFAEVEWTDPEWTFRAEDGRVTAKPLLPNAEDNFQFSVANAHSKQDEHTHEHTYDIYVSSSPITVHYRDGKGEIRTHNVATGALIVPPGVTHRVELHGTTFVFQAAAPGYRIKPDKIIAG